jgi:hypothetical protein
MEDREEMEAESTSNVPMLAAGGTFIAGTADGTVSEARYSRKRHRTAENMSEDLLNRHIQDYGLVSPERVKNLVWYFFKKYGTKQLNRQDDNLNLAQQALYTICLADQDRRRHCTVKLGKDNSPSSMMDHLRIHHLVEFDAVAVANSKGLTLAAFKAQQKEPRVRALLGNSSDINKYTLGTNGTIKGQPCGYTKGQVLCFTLDPRMVTLPQVDEDQEEAVWRVLEIRCKELMQDDETERKQSVHLAEPDALLLNPITDKSDNSQKTNLLGCKKTSKMVPPPDLTPAQNVVDVAKVVKEVIPRNINFLRPLLYTD